MRKKIIKRLFLLFKIALAVALLAWVLSGAHWNEYVQVRPAHGGGTWAVQTPHADRVDVTRGLLQWRENASFSNEQLLPISGTHTYIRKGIRGSLAGMHIGWFVAGMLGFPISLLVVGLRWWFLLRIQSIHISLWEATRLTFLGVFFNQVVPGTVGGDLVKAWYVCKHTPRVGAVLVSMFVDRVMGLIELILMAGVMLTLVILGGLDTFERLRAPAITVAVAGGLVICVMAFLLSSRLREFLHVQKLYQRLPIAHHFQAAGDAARIYRQHLGALVQAVLVTLGAHLLFVGAIAMLGLALRLNVPFYSYFVYIPLIYIIGAVPITPGGVGLVEKLYVGFFYTVGTVGVVGMSSRAGGGVGASEVVALAMLARLAQVFWGLPGLLVAVTGARRPKAEDIEAELQAAERAEEMQPQPPDETL